jgi:putative ABC transport system substrate-binding protein
MKKKFLISHLAPCTMPYALCLLGAMLFALCSSAQAQQPGKVPRIGFLSGGGDPDNPGPFVEAFRRGMRELGYIEGENIVIEYRFAAGKQERIPNLVDELVRSKIDVLVSPVAPAIRAAKQATKTIPIVMVTLIDPVETDLIDSLAQPGGNITGLTRLTRELSGKRLELFKEVVPSLSRVGILWDTDSRSSVSAFRDYEDAGRVLKLPIQSLEVRGPSPDFLGKFSAAAKERINAVVIIRNSLLNRYPKHIADLAIKYRVPSMCEGPYYVQSGCLMSYSANDAESYRRAAIYVDKILKGAKPADLPVEQPTKFEFVVNLKTAQQIGLTIPPNVLARADRVIK